MLCRRMATHRESVERFKARVERFLRRYSMAPSTFGRKACGNPKFVFLLREGRTPTIDTMDDVEAWMRDYRTDARECA